MLANFLGKSKPINFIVLLLLFIAAFFLSLFNVFSVEDFTLNFVINKLGIFSLFLVIFFFFNFILSKNNLTFDNSYAFLFYVLIISFFVGYLFNYKILFLGLVNLLFLRKVYSLHTLKDIFKKLFDAGFWLGIMTILNPFSLVFFLLIFASLILYGKVRFQTLTIPILGFLTPIFLFFSYHFWLDKTALFINNFLLYTTYDFSIYFENRFLIPLIIITLVLVFSIFMKTGSALSVNNTFKKSWLLLLIHLLISGLFVVLIFDKNGSELLLIAFPAAIIIANGFEMISKTFLKESILLLFILSAFLLPQFL